MERLRQLIHEIHRRSLWQVLGAFALLAAAELVLGPRSANSQDRTTAATIFFDVGHNSIYEPDNKASLISWLRSKGYTVVEVSGPIDQAMLRQAEILLLALPLADVNAFRTLPPSIEEQNAVWRLPTPSAYSEDEVAAISGWVSQGGGLLLVFDHMPLSGAAQDLAGQFGIEVANGFTVDQMVLEDARTPPRVAQAGSIVFRRSDGSLAAHVLTDGGMDRPRIDSIATFVGSAFRLPAEGASLLTLGQTFVTLLPEVAWQFDADTSLRASGGWSQGGVVEFGQGRLAAFAEAGILAVPSMLEASNDPQSQNPALLLRVLGWLSRAGGAL